jgi:hypothetical protein
MEHRSVTKSILIKGDIKMITGCLYDAILGMAKKMQTPVCMCLFTL